MDNEIEDAWLIQLKDDEYDSDEPCSNPWPEMSLTPVRTIVSPKHRKRTTWFDNGLKVTEVDLAMSWVPNRAAGEE